MPSCKLYVKPFLHIPIGVHYTQILINELKILELSKFLRISDDTIFLQLYAIKQGQNAIVCRNYTFQGNETKDFT